MKKTGFTILEVIVVVIILGVMASLAMPKLTGSIERTKAQEAVGILTSLRSAQLLYQQETGSFTSSIANLGVTISTPQNFNAPTVSTSSAAVASIVRGTGATYTLSINSAGTISCSGSSCGAAGY